MLHKSSQKSDDNTKDNSDGIDRSDSVRHASDSARQEAIAKMKQAQESEAAADTGSGDGDDNREVKETTIDPKAEKALKDLLGGTTEDTSSIKQVKVYSPFRVYYDSPASSVSALNGTGPFDVLPGHRNFLSLLAPGDIVVRSATGKEERITIERGVMHVHSNIVQVFLDV